jgi:hypothetical protein
MICMCPYKSLFNIIATSYWTSTSWSGSSVYYIYSLPTHSICDASNLVSHSPITSNQAFVCVR